MILLLESNRIMQKKLCDLLNRERIISVVSGTYILEMLCKYKREVSIIITNVLLLDEILTHQVLFKLCQKLAIEIPPILGFYKKADAQIKQGFEKGNKQLTFIEYNEKNKNFPEKYIDAIKHVYPGLNADINQAKDCWLRETTENNLIDIRKWLAEDEFLEAIEQQEIEKSAKPLDTITQKSEEKDYQKLYIELKAKYDELLRTISELMNIEKSDGG